MEDSDIQSTVDGLQEPLDATDGTEGENYISTGVEVPSGISPSDGQLLNALHNSILSVENPIL